MARGREGAIGCDEEEVDWLGSACCSADSGSERNAAALLKAICMVTEWLDTIARSVDALKERDGREAKKGRKSRLRKCA